jgi:hypothetical protein
VIAMQKMVTDAHRWTGRPRHTLLWDVAAVGIWVFIVAGFILAMCGLLWVAS